MDRLRVGHLRRGDDGRDVEVALRRRRRANTHRFIGHGHVLEVAVDRAVHGHRLDAQRMAGTQDAQGDFAAVGDDDFV
jgi:hypothetical protein